MDLASIARRSYARVLDSVPEDSPLREGDELLCPFCEEPMVVRRSSLGLLESIDGNRPAIDGVSLKHADDGCGFRPDFDVPLSEGRGYWPELTSQEEYAEEFERRDGRAAVDMAFQAATRAERLDRLEDLGYI